MFNNLIVEKVLESALNCRKDFMFRYIILEHNDIEQFANHFLEEDSNRYNCVSADDVYTFLENYLKSAGFRFTNDSVFIAPRVLSDLNTFVNEFTKWSSLNPNSNYLIPSCHNTNLEILTSLLPAFNSNNVYIPFLNRLSLDFASIVSDANYLNFEKEYEQIIVQMLRGCNNGSIFSNFLKANSNESFINALFDVISNSQNSGAISVEVASILGVEKLPAKVLQSYIEFVSPSAVDVDMFLSILNVLPITSFTMFESDLANPVFTKYIAFIENFINTNTVTKELITKMIDASTPNTASGWTILNLLNRVCTSYSSNAQQGTNTTEQNNYVQVQNTPKPNECFDPNNLSPAPEKVSVSNTVQSEGFVNPYSQFPLGENHQGFSYTENSEEYEELDVDDLPF